MPEPQNEARRELKQLVNWLVEGKLQEIEAHTSGIRLTAQMIREAIDEYPATLVKPPDEAFDKLGMIQIEDADPPEWYVRFDLWTAEEGRSDLSVECTVVAVEGKGVRIELDGIHVL